MKTCILLILMFLVVVSFCLPTKNENIQIIPSHFDNAVSTGKKLFGQHCSKCHGLNGTEGRFGAKNLQESVLDDEQYLRIIQKGKGIMPAWEKKLTSDQISDLITYIKILK